MVNRACAGRQGRRGKRAQAAGMLAAIGWDRGMWKRDCRAAPKGAPDNVNAMTFAGYPGPRRNHPAA